MSCSLAQPVHQDREVDGLEDEEVLTLGAGEHEQILDEPSHPVVLLAHDRESLRGLVGLGNEPQVAGGNGERGAQLVADIAQELALSSERAIEPIEHLVEGMPELGDLVAAGDLDPLAQVGLRDAPSRRGQRLDGREGTIGDEEGEDGADEEEQQRPCCRDADHRLDLPLILGDEPCGDEVPGLAVDTDGLGDEARRSQWRVELAPRWGLTLDDALQQLLVRGEVIARALGPGRPVELPVDEGDELLTLRWRVERHEDVEERPKISVDLHRLLIGADPAHEQVELIDLLLEAEGDARIELVVEQRTHGEDGRGCSDEQNHHEGQREAQPRAAAQQSAGPPRSRSVTVAGHR